MRRFIPAYAGNSQPVWSSHNRFPVHPRLRGELKQHGFINNRECGSSPLTRGTHSQVSCCFHQPRFIPAYAGNSLASVRHSKGASVHPRLRGELVSTLKNSNVSTGSSPLTRGTQEQNTQPRLMGRFIPAYAGNSVRVEAPDLPAAVHPRLRGELSSPSSAS